LIPGARIQRGNCEDEEGSSQAEDTAGGPPQDLVNETGGSGIESCGNPSGNFRIRPANAQGRTTKRAGYMRRDNPNSHPRKIHSARQSPYPEQNSQQNHKLAVKRGGDEFPERQLSRSEFGDALYLCKIVLEIRQSKRTPNCP